MVKSILVRKVYICSECRDNNIDILCFRNTLYNINANRIPGYAWGFDYINWKPMGYQRRETHPNEFAHYGRALAPYVATVVESGYVGGQERSSILPPPPLVTSRPLAASSQALSRDPVMGSIY